ncbi:MAG: DUF1861 family protein [Bdellovibrionales bacterium]|nr:DUF1861 family protein [Bdellovibrionales bacterium]
MKQIVIVLICLLTFPVLADQPDLNETDLLECSALALAKTSEVSDLLKEHRRSQHEALAGGASTPSSEKLVFFGVEGHDVYNPTKTFFIKFKGQRIQVLMARVEARNSEESQAMFFAKNGGVWSVLEGAPVFEMQDPFFTFIGGELILGGVEVFPKPDGGYGYRTNFYRGYSLEELTPKKPFANGPIGMKDIRLVEIKPGVIGLFTRPQGMIPGTTIDAGPGRIGFATISSLEALLDPNTILRAPLISAQFADKEWGGVNEAQMLPDGKIAVLAHVARFDSGKNRHYYAAVFTVDPFSQVVSPFEVILERADLVGGLGGNSKRSDLKDVVFSGGMILHADSAILFVGAGDSEVHIKIVRRPKLFGASVF